MCERISISLESSGNIGDYFDYRRKIASEMWLGGTWALVPSSLMKTLSLLHWVLWGPVCDFRLLGKSTGEFSYNEDLHK